MPVSILQSLKAIYKVKELKIFPFSSSNMANEEKVVSERNMKKSLGKFPIEVKSVFPKRRQEVLNLNGWGFSDSYFYYENGLKFKGTR